MGENGEEKMQEEWKSVVTNDTILSNLRLNNNEFNKNKEGNDGEEEKERRFCSLAERRAAKYGFNAARFRSLGSPGGGGNPIPCLTIPPGISPNALLDSPIMLPNSQSSPTTGALPFPPLGHESSTTDSRTHAADVDMECNSSFSFRPTGSPISLPFSGSENQGSSPCDFSQSSDADVDCGTLTPGQQSIDFEFPPELLQEISPTRFCYDKPSDENLSNMVNLNAIRHNFPTSQLNGHTPQQRDCLDEEAHTGGPLQGVEKAIIPQMGLAKTSEDGYNWRKYGQKQVKGSEYPRSYYKCTHPSCPVKKKVERSHDGQITEIVYKGSHSHPKPLPNRRSVLVSAYSFNELPQMIEGSDSYSRIEGGSVWRNIQPGSRDTTDWRHDSIERASSTSVLTDLSDHISSHGKTVNIFGSAGSPNQSPTIASNDDDNDEDRVIQGSLSIGDDAEDDESDSKRRKTEDCLIETNLGYRAVREPRVVVQIESDVDILDDGYRWRKYGQKVVKGNPNPRSYYKCTSAGCSVRKHVERASHNLKFVITTYEGKHNHEVPASRNSIHMNSNNANLPPTAPTVQSTHLLSRHATIPKTETHIQDFMPHFEQKPNFGNGFLRLNIPGNCSDLKFATSIYPMKFPPMPYGSFELNRNYAGVPQAALRNSMVQDFPVPLPVTLSRLGEPGLGGFDFSNCGRSIGQVPSFQESESMRFLRPKQEEKDEDMYDSSSEAQALSTSSSVYHQMIGRFAS